MSSKLNILAIGGSRHIGYHASLRFLDDGATVTFLLRDPSSMDGDLRIQEHVRSGKARLIKGDGLVLNDVRNVWNEASEERPVDVVLFTVGFTGKPSFHLTKGFVITPQNLVSQCLLNLLCEMPKTNPIPKIIALSTVGSTKSSRKQASLMLKVLYGYLIQSPIKDKLGMERIIYHCAGWNWNPYDGEPEEEVVGKGWRQISGLPAPGTLRNAMVVRAGVLTDGECRADSKGSKAYRVEEGEVGGYDISREDVAHFIFQAVKNHWNKYGGRQVSVAY